MMHPQGSSKRGEALTAIALARGENAAAQIAQQSGNMSAQVAAVNIGGLGNVLLPGTSRTFTVQPGQVALVLGQALFLNQNKATTGNVTLLVNGSAVPLANQAGATQVPASGATVSINTMGILLPNANPYTVELSVNLTDQTSAGQAAGTLIVVILSAL